MRRGVNGDGRRQAASVCCDDIELVSTVEFDQEDLVEGFNSGLGQFITQPLFAVTDAFELIAEDLAAFDQQVVEVSIALFDNRDRTVGFDLCELNVFDGEDPPCCVPPT